MADASENTEGLRISIADGIATLTLDCPSIRNGIREDVALEYAGFFEEANQNPDVRAIVLTSTGKDFSIGGAPGLVPKPPARTQMDYRFTSLPHIAMFKAIWEVEKPVVSAVNGTVAGVGWLLALLADLVVAAKGSRWTHVFVRQAMIPHAGDSFFLPRIIPFHRLNEIALLGDAVTADTLSEWGLINRLVEPGAELDTAMELARKLADQPTRSLGLAKRHYRRSLEADFNTMMREEMAGQALNSTTVDRQEAGKARGEGRKPRFVGD
ncbi:enoyl-CoA hydratase/isomerase family protein [Novosphingobium cyanobacteriorum]|uniref:Enoyl-CoA hydratase/isomerase family protein n=1 Tax=Novosphingobium cyanobacteriorum TaxID=3024215 RepID=A0ABT6CM22_9SPHN|nr:enoyl-CoA hydratase/isomerase family protein [Novosphingobium cyanobacteriorum]MDF8334963.1 enoyl-CoA hydratase/isomerase family protein [Novosphingobium cyanobacteriorum]